MAHQYRNLSAPIEIKSFEDAIRAVAGAHFDRHADIDVSINTTFEDEVIPELNKFRIKPRYELEITLRIDITDTPLTHQNGGDA